jgi:hypothetical protein
VENIVKALECIMGESKVVFLSSRVKLLANVIQAFLILLWPFSWVRFWLMFFPFSFPLILISFPFSFSLLSHASPFF